MFEAARQRRNQNQAKPGEAAAHKKEKGLGS
jgi:hypothetical protein